MARKEQTERSAKQLTSTIKHSQLLDFCRLIRLGYIPITIQSEKRLVIWRDYFGRFSSITIRRLVGSRKKGSKRIPQIRRDFCKFNRLLVYTEADSICKKVGDLMRLFWAIFLRVIIRQVDKTRRKIAQKRPSNSPRFLQIDSASVYVL